MQHLIRYAVPAVLGTLMTVTVGAAAADRAAFPVKPIRIIVPFPPGGGTDFVTRALAPSLGEALGTSIIIDNRSGAQGVVGTQIGAQAGPDGHTLVVVDAATVIAPAMMDKAPFDVLKDFAPIGMLVEQPYLVTVHPSVPAKNLAEFVKLAQANPGKYNFGSGAAIGHVSQEVFYTLAKLKMTHVPYRGTGPLMTALLGNEVQVTFSGPGSALPHVRSGRLRPLAVTTLKRARELPDVPSLSELGFKGFEIRGWYGLLAPAGTPPPVVARLNTELNKLLSGGQTEKVLKDRGLDPSPVSPDEFGRFLKSEVARWSQAVKQYNVKQAE